MTISELLSKVKKRKDEVLADVRSTLTAPFPKTVSVQPNSFTGKLAQGISNLGEWRNILEGNKLEELPKTIKVSQPTKNKQRALNAGVDIASNLLVKPLQGGYNIASATSRPQASQFNVPQLAKGVGQTVLSGLNWAGASKPLTAVGYSALPGVITGASEALSGKNTRQALSSGIGASLEFLPKALPMAGVIRGTQPIMDKLVGKASANIRLPIKVGTNVGQGLLVDRASGFETTPESIALDVIFPIAGDVVPRAYKSASEAMRSVEAKVLSALGKKLRNNKGAYTTAKKFINKTRSYNKTGKYAMGSFMGFEPYQDDDGNWRVRFDEKKALAGLALAGFTKSVRGGTAEDLMKSIKRSTLAKKYGDNALEMIGQEARRLAEAVEGVDIIPIEGGKYMRSSRNPKWYKDFYADYNRAPTNEELFGIAEKNLRTGGGVEGYGDLVDPAEVKAINDFLDGDIIKKSEGNVIASVEGGQITTPSARLPQRASEFQQPRNPRGIKLEQSKLQTTGIPATNAETYQIPNRMLLPEVSSPVMLPQNNTDIKLLPKRVVRNGEVVGEGFTIENYKHPLTRRQAEIKTQSILKQEAQASLKQANQRAEDLAKTIGRSIGENTQGAIKREVTATEKEIANSFNWKDKKMGKLAYGRETMNRNFDDIMGKDAPRMKSVYLDPIGKSEADRIRFLNKEKAEIKALGIKAFSNESKLLQLYGEGKINLPDLKARTKDWQKVVIGERFFRAKYDDYLNKINSVLIKNGYDPIPRRKDYFLHFHEIGSVLENFGIPAKADALPTDINGLTADFKPGKNFFASALPRLGDKTKFDAVEGIERYLGGASKQIFHTDNIQRLRGLEESLREMHAGSNRLSNFVADLTEFTNNLAGKKSMLDRGLEAAVGRGVYTATNTMRRQVGANMVGGNVSSALTNFIPLTQSMATTSKPSFIRGMLDTISTTIKDDGFIDKSDFLTRRFGDDRLAVNLWQKVGDKAGWLFKTIDRFTSETIVRSKYYEGLKRGLNETDAIKRADDWAMRVMADRSVGQQPTLFNSKTMGFLTQFELEVNNQLSFIFKDLPRNYRGAGLASAMGQVFLYGYLFNNLFEKATGRRPAFDPIGVAVQAYEDYTNENIKSKQATKNLVNNTTAQLPFVGIVTEGGRIPVSSAMPDIKGLIDGTTTFKKEGLKAASNLLLPTGGGQIRKFIEGTKAYNQGASITDKGNVRYPIPQTPVNRVRTSLFGQYSTPEARTYFREGRSVLGEKQSEYFKNASPEQKQNIYQMIIKNRQDKNKQSVDTGGKAFAAEVENGYISDNEYNYIDKNGSIKKIALEFTAKPPKLTGNEELDKERIKDYKSAVTSRKNDIIKLLDAGVITEKQAEEQLSALSAINSSYTSTGTTKKAKKLSIPAPPKIKITAPKKRALLKIKRATSAKSKKLELPKMVAPTPTKSAKKIDIRSISKAFAKYA